MKIHFYLRYTTKFGDSIELRTDAGHRVTLHYVNDSFWHGSLFLAKASSTPLAYSYTVNHQDGTAHEEWSSDRFIVLPTQTDSLAVVDHWNAGGEIDNAFFTQPFQDIIFRTGKPDTAQQVRNGQAVYTHLFKVKAPLLRTHESLCIVGADAALGDWEVHKAVRMQRNGHWWTAAVTLPAEAPPPAYKYGIWDNERDAFHRFEAGENRALPSFATVATRLIVHDGFAQLGSARWRGAGVSIPVFSLRSNQSGGVGEFTDLPALSDWAAGLGMRVLQLLPINDTSATGAFTDSYPYAAISAFALHPLYLNVAEVAGKKYAALVKEDCKALQNLNALPEVDYVEVMRIKWQAFVKLYDALRDELPKDKAYQTYLAENVHWLRPYAAFCALKKRYGTADFSQWALHSVYDEAAIGKFTDPTTKHHDEVAIHYFVQWHLHRQLKTAIDHAHAKGLVVKGDLPIGIYRYSADAWVAPELYNMNQQAGAPPDDFAEKGQNWGFPTYNWARMKQDGFAWWSQRFAQMSLYFDLFRIDHILGFFRIWSVPLHAVEGILGQFVPAIPVTERELREAGIGFSYNRLCKPFINEQTLWAYFGEAAPTAAETYLLALPDGTLELKPEFATQRQVAAHFDALPDSPANQALRQGLYDLISNVILLPGEQGDYHFRFGIEQTTSFKHLEPFVQRKLKDLYVDYFYRRQDNFWEMEAMDKLPALKQTTNMLICGEDLGMVPACVPGVMRALGFLSLEIQRMPKAAGHTFFHPKDAPYLSVVTPGTHDMSTLRGWWEEDRDLSQRFYNEILGMHGQAPWFCEPWVNRAIISQHLQSPAMWCIVQWQDLLGMDGALRREDPAAERINVPANPKHYWRYRMHRTLEEMTQAHHFNQDVRQMVIESGRS